MNAHTTLIAAEVRTPAERAAVADRVANEATRPFFVQAERIVDADRLRARLRAENPVEVYGTARDGNPLFLHDRFDLRKQRDAWIEVRVAQAMRTMKRADDAYASLARTPVRGVAA